MASKPKPDPNLFSLLVEDGLPLLTLTGVALFLSGIFAIFLAARREFLPHDIGFLGMSADELCRFAECRIVRFMFHDRVAFGGTLIAVAVLCLWLAALPLRDGYRWAWFAFTVSGSTGFLSFLAYLGYGYLDSWHGVATLALLPCFVVGQVRSFSRASRLATPWIRSPQAAIAPIQLRHGRSRILATGVGMIMAGVAILIIGMTRVFVPEDLAFIGLTRDVLQGINQRLIPLIAHDRAGFGGGLISSGLLVIICAWYAPPSRSYWQATAIAGIAGFGCAIAVHFVEGYTDSFHLAPAFAGALLFAFGSVLEFPGLRELAARQIS